MSLMGHNRAALKPDRTLQRMRIHPLMSLLESFNPLLVSAELPASKSVDAETSQDHATTYNGVFALSYSTSLTLALDFKSKAEEMFSSLQAAVHTIIQKDWITYLDTVSRERVERPITLAASGNAGFDLIIRTCNSSVNGSAETGCHIFYDAPLGKLVQSSDPDAPTLEQAIGAGAAAQGLKEFRDS